MTNSVKTDPTGLVSLDAPLECEAPSPKSRQSRLLPAGFFLLIVGYPILVGFSGTWAPYFDAAIFALVVTATAVACWRAYRIAERTEKRFWLLLVVISVLTTVSQTAAAIWLFDASGAGLPIPSVLDAINLAAALCFCAFAGVFLRKRTWTRASAVRHILDALSITAMAYAFIAYLYVAPLFGAHGMSGLLTIAVASAYPLLGTGIMGLLLMSGLGIRARAWMPWERLLSAAMAVYASGLLAWPALILASDYVHLNVWAVLFSLVFLVGYYLLFATAVVRIRSTDAQTLRSVASRIRVHHASLAVVVPLLALGVAVTIGYFSSTGSPSSIDALGRGIALLLIVLLAIRSSAVVYENATLQQLAVTDPLTGLLDRRQFIATAAEQVEAAQRYGDPVALMIMDLDGFASVNSRLGARAADTVLVDVANAIVRAVRPGDTVYRAGDDEFAILAPDCTAQDALRSAEDVRQAVRDLRLHDGVRVTVSMGVALFPQDALDHLYLLRRAEGAAYFAKTHGKDQVVRYSALNEFDLSPKLRAERLQNESRVSTVRALAAAVDARDSATQYHSRNVARLAVALAKDLDLEPARIEALETAALLHDIGKIGVADRILRKAGHLTAAERLEVQQHAVLGERILAGTNLKEILPWILAHHERWDGTGYPAGLAGEEIPFEARILAVCDAYDAMTSDRPYRLALSSAAALQEIDLNMGTQFDPSLAEAFIALVSRSGDIRPMPESDTGS